MALGDPQVGWDNMLNNAGGVIGLSATTFGNRMGCDGPFGQTTSVNQTTLRDLGRLYEQMAVNPAVLFPAAVPFPFDFSTTDAYNFMDNHVNDNFIGDIVDEQAAEIGLAESDLEDFNDAVRLVHKTGSNSITDDETPYRTIAGWISLPINGGAATRDYVYGVFFNDVTSETLGNLRNDAAEMLRPVIRDALEDF